MRLPSLPSAALVLLLAASPGCIYAHFKTPLDTDLNVTKLGDKTGRASWHSILYLVATGDAGTQAAAENGNVTTIRHADREFLSVLFGLYFRETTIVYGD